MDDPKHPPHPKVSFSLFGQQKKMLLRRLAIVSTLFHEPETVMPLYTLALTSVLTDKLWAWWPIIGREAVEKKSRPRLYETH
ncbi:hypothetical protein Hanom_Chr02g00107051 [Helianthus anomalus]